MDCRRVTTLITEYLFGALDFKTTSAWRAHLLDCSDCVAFLETYRKCIKAIHALPSKDIPPEAGNRIRRLLKTRIKHPSPNG